MYFLTIFKNFLNVVKKSFFAIFYSYTVNVLKSRFFLITFRDLKLAELNSSTRQVFPKKFQGQLNKN